MYIYSVIKKNNIINAMKYKNVIHKHVANKSIDVHNRIIIMNHCV